MSKSIAIQNVNIVNEGEIYTASVWIFNGIIQEISEDPIEEEVDEEIDGTGLYLMPGIIDGQVHFRDPGLTHKADLNSETRAAVAGGVTSFFDMPNTVPNALTPALLIRYGARPPCVPGPDILPRQAE